MRARTFTGKFQGASVIASTMLVTLVAQASSPPPHKKSHAKAHGHHTSRAPHTSTIASRAITTSADTALATPSPPQIVAPLDAAPSLPASPSRPWAGANSDAPVAGDGALEPPDRDRADHGSDPVVHRVALTLNPIPMIIGRFGANLEVMLASHHAVVASGFVQTYSSAVMHVLVPQADISNLPSPLLGGELGYRLYSGSDGPSGLFVGPSLVMMPFAYPHVGSDLRAEMVAFETYGAALDIGAQAVVAGGLTIGGGIGVEYLAYTPPASIAPPPGASVPSYPEPHVLPRVLLAAGWAF